MRMVAGDTTFKKIHFYKANLADVEQTKATWERIVSDHGQVHILVNNHAICQGKRVEELNIERFKLTMDINFNSYVHLAMLFLAQNGTKNEAEASRFHLVNVNSIAGHMTCQRNSDYSASKFALTGFTEALRQELEFKGSPVKMTNFYPYYIDTGLFEGFSPTMRFILPTLKAEKVTRRMHQAIMAEEKEVYIEPIIWWLKNVMQFVPLALKTRCSQILVG
jgi:short-subunit dehydrogenase|mmetsp:Transcript_26831/g.35885  ORF Transcript_26831/g.35885 Transcript_26831/m.35885 type:complete len:221 (+) Transcript_26831:375-1037(+)|eukprot:CAMPEP_0185577258 /NCGR_PEP_ID=MMETSP0434-20130131/9472_1 /TAXON_ID=626734 ORGANISM="Favella taraikaensis, Strain Fe Narragansett Bay" /NCGR_SAMPLE_ID=MMETSP0434 /ASSEMBLY_ACC=CAM_ASM_000379 /LENGTH=220 /DNA_ID=CAMNT_0028194769 /DNA_START=379 /DNA_END=1041 /DNA_ORIENTATION=+